MVSFLFFFRIFIKINKSLSGLKLLFDIRLQIDAFFKTATNRKVLISD